MKIVKQVSDKPSRIYNESATLSDKPGGCYGELCRWIMQKEIAPKRAARKIVPYKPMGLR